MQNQQSGGDVKHRTKHRKWDDIKRTAVPNFPRNTRQPINAIMTIPAPLQLHLHLHPVPFFLFLLLANIVA